MEEEAIQTVDQVVRRGLSRNTQRLLKGLVARGAVPHGASFHIVRDHGQPMMNKAAGEAAPTWMLHSDPLHMMGRVVRAGGPATVVYEDRRYEGVQSHMPLTWILKQPAEAWDLGLHEDGRALEILVDKLPPTWLF